MDNEVIYCLAEINGPPFYVGRTNNPQRRFQEHRSAAKDGTEAKYQHIRKLWAENKDFELLVIDDNPQERYEKYYHFLLGIEYDLTNMRIGDEEATESIVSRGLRDQKFMGPAEFLTEFDRRVAEEEARRKAEKTQAKIRSKNDCVSSDPSLTLFAGERLNDRFVSPALRDRLLRRTKK